MGFDMMNKTGRATLRAGALCWERRTGSVRLIVSPAKKSAFRQRQLLLLRRPPQFLEQAEELKTYPFTLPKVDEAEAGKCADKDAATTCFVDGNTLLVDLGTEQTVSSFHYLPDKASITKD